MNSLRKIIAGLILCFAFISAVSFADSLFLPNLNKSVTGTSAAGHNGLDVNLLGGITIGSVNQGSPTTIGNAWPVKPTDGTNIQAFTASGEAKVDLTSFAKGQATMANSFPVVISSDQSVIPASQSGTWNITNVSGTVSLPTGASTEATLSTLSGKVANNYGAASGAVRVASQVGNSIGAADFGAGTTSAQTLRVVLPTDQTAIPASQSGTWNITNVSGTVSLPTGAATSANQTNASQKTQVVDGSGNVISSTLNAMDVNLKTSGLSNLSTNVAQFGGSAVVTGTGVSGGGIPRVTISNDSSLAAHQSTNVDQIGGSTLSFGSKTSANSIPVVIASDQGAIPETVNGNTPLQFVRNDYSITNVTTGAYVQLIASTSGTTNVIEIFDSSGQTLKIAFGAAGFEVDQFIVFPGGNGRITCKIASGTRVSIKALSGTASTGEIDINLHT